MEMSSSVLHPHVARSCLGFLSRRGIAIMQRHVSKQSKAEEMVEIARSRVCESMPDASRIVLCRGRARICQICSKKHLSSLYNTASVPNSYRSPPVMEPDHPVRLDVV